MKIIEKNHIFSILDQYLKKQQSIVVWVSWWPDSIMLAYILQQYYTFRWWKQSNIYITHFNHWQRKEWKKELNFIQKHFKYNTIYRNTNIPSKWLWETKLRELRHTFFEEVIKESKSTILFLWHNLTDRIETSLLNIVRWCSMDWFESIKHTQKKKLYTIYRPLLEITKSKIQKFCDTHSLKYFIDKSNNTPITPRNILRNTIIPSIQSLHSGWENNRYQSRNELYNWLKKPKIEYTLSRNSNKPNSLWWATKRYSLPLKEITPNLLFELFKDVYYATQKTIKAIQSFINSWSGYMYVWWWYIFIVWSELHCINGTKDFWKQKITKSKKLTVHWKQEYNWYIFTAPKEWVWKTIRYPIEWDTYKKKRLLKYMLNKKIPVFMRNTTPVIESNKEIIAILQYT